MAHRQAKMSMPRNMAPTGTRSQRPKKKYKRTQLPKQYDARPSAKIHSGAGGPARNKKWLCSHTSKAHTANPPKRKAGIHTTFSRRT
jgi:hypothetical protein